MEVIKVERVVYVLIVIDYHATPCILVVSTSNINSCDIAKVGAASAPSTMYPCLLLKLLFCNCAVN